jgi:anti-anti-sigma factor
MNIVITEEGLVSVVSVSGRMDATTSADFDKAAKDLLAENRAKILVDLSGLEFVSSAGLRVLLILGKACQTQNKSLAFCGLNPMVQEIFSISSFDSIFKIYADKGAALEKI